MRYRDFLAPIVFLISAVFLYFGAQGKFYYLLIDDAYFYVKIARNLSLGLGSTFDGVNPTNGYHPLYLLLLAAISYIKPLVGLGGIQVVFVVDVILMALGLFLFDQVMKKYKIDCYLRTTAALIAAFVLGHLNYGMEPKLLIPLFWLLCLLVFKGVESRKNIFYFFIGIAAALVILTRLDTVIVVCFCFTLLLIQELQEQKLTIRQMFLRTLALCLPVVCLVGLYLFINKYYFGHFGTVSSHLKLAWPGVFRYHWLNTAEPHQLIRYAFSPLCAILFLGYTFLFARTKFDRTYIMPLSIALYVVSYSILIFSLSKIVVFSNYLALSIAGALFLMVLMLDAARNNRTDTKITLFSKWCTFLLIPALLIFSYARGESVLTKECIVCECLDRTLPKDAVLYWPGADSGLSGYLSDIHIINGDGLVNSWEYLEYLESGRLLEFLKRSQVEYIYTSHFNEGQTTFIAIDFFLSEDRGIILKDTPSPICGNVFKIDFEKLKFVDKRPKL